MPIVIHKELELPVKNKVSDGISQSSRYKSVDELAFTTHIESFFLDEHR